MAWDINRVVLVGRVSGDVELRSTPSGAAVARFGLAVGGRPNKDGSDSVSFFNIVIWNKGAEIAEKYLSKGSRIAVDGRLEQRSWTDQSGTRRSTVEVIAERLEFLSTPQNAGQGGGGSYQSNNSNQQYGGNSSYNSRPSSAEPAHQIPAQQSNNDYYDTTDFNDAPLDKYEPFDEDVPF